MILRVLESLWAPFAAALAERHDVETAGIILAERIGGGDVLIARELLPVPAEGYQIRRADRLRIDPVALNRLVRPARERSLSVLTIHTHPQSRAPWFSYADDAGDARLMPSLFSQIPGPHGSLVLAGETGAAVGRVWRSQEEPAEGLAVHVIGEALQIHPAFPSAAGADQWWDRQKLALGPDGQAVLAALHIGIVGLGGTGSVVLAQVAHLGVGRITVVDGDRVESSNVSRIIGATAQDAGVSWKVDVAARYANQLGLGARVRVLRGHLGNGGLPASDLESCDILISCVDTHTPRVLLNRLSYERQIPLIDLGSAFRVAPAGEVIGSAGRVVVAGPGKPCLACWGHLDPERLRIEALPAAERLALAREGYIDGADLAQPSVIAFNTAVAGLAVVELLRLVTRFAGAEAPPLRLGIDFATGVVRRNRVQRREECRICSGGGAMVGARADVEGWLDDRADD